MPNTQSRQNPDVNSFPMDDDSGTTEQENTGRNGSSDIERPPDTEIPVPPDKRPVAPIEDPPDPNKAPVGDVDDSPKRIAGDE